MSINNQLAAPPLENMRLLDLCLKFILLSHPVTRGISDKVPSAEGGNTAQTLLKKYYFKKIMESAKCCNCREPFADSKGKALSFLLLFALQLTYMPSCINRITTETRSAPGFLCQVPWSRLKKQAQGMHRKQTSPIEVPGWSFLLFSPPLRNMSSFTDSTGQQCHGHVAPRHLLNCVEAALGHSNLVNRLALQWAPEISFQFQGNALPACVPGTFCSDFFRASRGRRMLSPCLLAHRQRGEGGVHPGSSQGAPEPVWGSR